MSTSPTMNTNNDKALPSTPKTPLPTQPTTPPDSSEKLIAGLETLATPPPSKHPNSNYIDLLEAAEQLRRDLCAMQWTNASLSSQLQASQEEARELKLAVEDLKLLAREVEAEKEEWMERYGVVRQEMVEAEEGMGMEMRYSPGGEGMDGGR